MLLRLQRERYAWEPRDVGCLVALALVLAGSAAAFLYARAETAAIARAVRAERPNDPLDGVPIIGWAITVVGALVSAVVGTIAGGATGMVLARRARRSAAPATARDERPAESD